MYDIAVAPPAHKNIAAEISHPAWRRLAPGRRRRCLAAAAARDTRASRHAEAADRGRGARFSALTISYKAPLYDTGIPSPDGRRRPFSGEPEQIAGDIRSFAAIGVYELIFG
jgi:hypothetical protein